MTAQARRTARRGQGTLALALVLLLVAVAPAGAAVDPALTRYPYLTDSIQTSITVNWATNQLGAGTVKYGPEGSCTARSATATSTGIKVNDVQQYQWKATLPVIPDTRYCYRVYLGTTDLLAGDPSPDFTSQVAAGSTKPFSFVVFGDWGEATADPVNPNPHQANVLAQMARSGARFAVMTGDTAYPSGSQKNYGDLHQTGADVSSVFGPKFWAVPGRSLPVFNVTGNHGFTGGQNQIDNWPEENAAASSGGRYTMEDYPAMPELGTNAGRYPSMWYAFDAGPARFYVLTTAWADGNGATVGFENEGCDSLPARCYAADAAAHWQPRSAEYQWLKRDLAAHPGGLKFAFWHYPLYADTKGSGATDTYLHDTLQPLLNSHRVNIVFNGHAHGYERNHPDAAGMVSYVLGNGGADLNELSKDCSVFDAYAISADGRACGMAPEGLSDDHVFGFAKVTVDGGQVTVTPTDEMGRTYDVQTYRFPGAPPPPPPATPTPTPTPTATPTPTSHTGPPATRRPIAKPAGRCAARLLGTAARDRIGGTRGGDHMLGLGGDDVIKGHAGADCMRGGAGRDDLSGGSGDDRLWGERGADLLFGGPGRDLLYGGRGADVLDGGSARDRLYGDSGRDELRGGTGADHLDGGSARDTYFAGPRADTIDARDGTRDRVRCGSGRDIARVDRADLVSGCERVTVARRRP